MKRDFLKNLQVNGTALPDGVVDAILREHARVLEAATADPGVNGGTGGKTFTQEEVNRIVANRLAQEREKGGDDEREKALKAREIRLDCRDYLDSMEYPAGLLDVLDSSDAGKFKAAAEKLMKEFPMIAAGRVPPPYAAETGAGPIFSDDRIAAAFKPSTT